MLDDSKSLKQNFNRFQNQQSLCYHSIHKRNFQLNNFLHAFQNSKKFMSFESTDLFNISFLCALLDSK